MNDFELQRRLREMSSPILPQADLWPGIATRIAAEQTNTRVARRPGSRLPLAAAAAVLLAVVSAAVLLGIRGHDQDLAITSATTLSKASPRGAKDFSRAPGGDPRLLGAAIVLDAAHAELEQALEQRPDAVFLVSLLNRTNAQRLKLDYFGANAG